MVNVKSKLLQEFIKKKKIINSLTQSFRRAVFLQRKSIREGDADEGKGILQGSKSNGMDL